MEYKYFTEEEIEFLKESKSNEFFHSIPRFNKFIRKGFALEFVDSFCAKWDGVFGNNEGIIDYLYRIVNENKEKNIIDLSYKIIEYLFNLKYLERYYINIIAFKFKILDKDITGIRSLENANIICKELSEIYKDEESDKYINLHVLYQHLIKDKQLQSCYFNQKYNTSSFIENKINKRRVEIENELNDKINKKSKNKGADKKETLEEDCIKERIHNVIENINVEEKILIEEKKENKIDKHEDKYLAIYKLLKDYITHASSDTIKKIIQYKINNDKLLDYNKTYIALESFKLVNAKKIGICFSLINNEIKHFIRMKEENGKYKLISKRLPSDTKIYGGIDLDDVLLTIRNDYLHEINPKVYPLIEK